MGSLLKDGELWQNSVDAARVQGRQDAEVNIYGNQANGKVSD